MSVIRFTDLGIRSLPEGQYFDERTSAFGLRVGKRKKTWFVINGTNRNKLRLGHYPALSLAEARKKALVAIGSPLEPSHAPMFPEARDQYLAQGKWRPRTQFENTRVLNRYFHWTKPLDKITHRDVAEAIDAVQAKSEAIKAFKNIHAFFGWCIPRYIDHSPCTGLKRPTGNPPRSRVLSDDELRRVWLACPQGAYGATIKTLILCGQRLVETASIRPEWLEGNILTIPASVTKNKKLHRLPVPQSAIPLIAQLKLSKTWTRGKPALDKASGVRGWVHHDLRRTYATNMQRLGIRLEVTEKLLNHVSGSQRGIVSVYQKYDFWPEMQEAVARYEHFLLRLLASREPT